MTQEQGYRPSLYLTINVLFITLILFIGGILAWHNYRDTKQLVLSDVELEYDQILSSFAKDFQHTYKPVFDTVGLLAMTPVMEALSLDERLQHLHLLSKAISNSDEIAGLQVGYANGDYFILRPTRSTQLRSLFKAPDNTAFIVDNIATDSATGQRWLNRLFFDEALSQILRNPPEATEYDPRTRSWYLQALKSDRVASVAPYLFYFLKEVGTTISRARPGTKAVIAADVTLQQVSETLAEYMLTPGSEIALLDGNGYVLGHSQTGKNILQLEGENFKLARLDELDSEVFTYAITNKLIQPGPLEFSFAGRTWHGSVGNFKVNTGDNSTLTLIMLSPLDELLADVIKTVKTSLLMTLAILLASLPLAAIVAGVISKVLKKLAEEAVLISRFDFKNPIALRSRIKEVDELALSMELMKSTISRFLALTKALASEQNFDAMLEQITEQTLQVCGSDGVLTWLVDDTTNSLSPVALFVKETGKVDLDGLPSYALDSEQTLAEAANLDSVSQRLLYKSGNDGLEVLFEFLDVESIEVTAFPLRNRKNEVIGLLCQMDGGTDQRQKNAAAASRMDFVRTFSGFASVSLESRHLLEMQKRLLDSFILLLAGAIDAKSPYTGGHCQRVPVLVKMLAKAACEDEGFFKDFQLDKDGWEALHLAGWLHDCGKVTTPEYVVDKATKLETLYDRIHEIRTRFEVLKRDQEIRYWEQVADGGDSKVLREELERELRQIDEDFNFVAACNLGEEPITDEQVERLEKIAERTWTRTLDDRVGISWEEEKRKARLTRAKLPVEEHVLADRIDHLIERTEDERIPEDNPWGFKIAVPEYRYNRGELYNLKIKRGTLTPEERYKISDHVVQTIIMLEKLPYPKHLREVPTIAGSHHETMDGQGYPKKLNKTEMSVAARMVAVADIFEALTAADRPYKKPRKLSDAIRIMNAFKKDQHIDSELFELFLRSGIYLDYAREYLAADQVDEVDIESYLS